MLYELWTVLRKFRNLTIAVVLQCGKGEVVQVDPDRASPVGRVVFGVVLHVQGTAWRKSASAT
jgi:hypothetical protein